MVTILPFRALRYALEKVLDLSRVVAPPYDVITPDDQERLHAASPYNVVRLILGQQSPTDTHKDNRYTRARGEFDRWCADGVLRRDATPSLSLIEHRFTWQGTAARRLGFVGLLRLEETVSRCVFRHEATLESPKADRRQLLEAVPANLSPIFCVYPDPDGAVQALLEHVRRQAAPLATAALGSEVVRIWTVTEPATIEAIQQRLASANFLIADGHHRFEVAYANRARYGAVMAYFVSMREPALKISPIHRLVRFRTSGPADPTPTIKRLEALQPTCALQPAAHLKALVRWVPSGGPGRFGCVVRGGLYQVAVSEQALARWHAAPPVPAPLAGLDVSLLHGLVFPALGIGEGHLTYTASAEDARRSVETQKADMAWLLSGIPIEQVYAIASGGVTLPPKSTFFYPKVLSGLVFNPFFD